MHGLFTKSRVPANLELSLDRVPGHYQLSTDAVCRRGNDTYQTKNQAFQTATALSLGILSGYSGHRAWDPDVSSISVVVGIFPNKDSYIRLITIYLIEYE